MTPRLPRAQYESAIEGGGSFNPQEPDEIGGINRGGRKSSLGEYTPEESRIHPRLMPLDGASNVSQRRESYESILKR